MSTTADCSSNNSELKSLKRLLFSDSDGREALHVEIIETTAPHYSLYIWPCAVVLAQYIWFHRKHILKEKHVLEIGAGTALPSIIAAMVASPATVTITDDSFHPRCFENCRESLNVNKLFNVCDHFLTPSMCSTTSDTNLGCPIHLMGLSWGTVDPHLAQLTSGNKEGNHHLPEIILGSDCFYDENLFEKLLCTIFYLLKSKSEQLPQNSKSIPIFLCTYQVRCADWSITHLLCKWGLQYENIPLKSFLADRSNIGQSNMPGNHTIEMMKISLASSN